MDVVAKKVIMYVKKFGYLSLKISSKPCYQLKLALI